MAMADNMNGGTGGGDPTDWMQEILRYLALRPANAVNTNTPFANAEHGGATGTGGPPIKTGGVNPADAPLVYGPQVPADLAGAAAGTPDWLKWIKTGLAGTSLVGAVAHGSQGNTGGAAAMIPELQQLLDLQKQRMQMQNPLFEAVTRMAYNRLPTNLTQSQGPTDPITLAMQKMTGGG